MKDIVFRTIMLKGEKGSDIQSIEKTSSSGVVDTYTITLSDGTTETFTVTNGSDIASIEKTATSGLIDTYTVTLTDGSTTTFEVKNGADAQLYEIPTDSVIGYDSEDNVPSGYEEINSPFDASLNSTSDNAPQTKAVKAAIDAAIDTVINNFNYDAQVSANITSKTSPFTDIGSFDLTSGLWLVIATVNFAANATGYRCGLISTSSNASGADYRGTVIVGASPTDVTRIQIVSFLQVSEPTTYYIEGKQNSGSTLSATARVQRIKLK